MSDKYEPVIGLEVHAQLTTKSKAYSDDSAAYGGTPNTHVSPVSLGMPGTLPVLNQSALEYAVKAGLAFNCKINRYNEFARKNYFYADLPKGYQISQHTTPLCTDGFLMIKINGVQKKIGITRIHMEEDSGKSIHDLDPYFSLVDLNRAGVPLIEIVSEPDIASADEAYQYVTEVRKLVRYLDICDGNMEEGSLRCDANISVKLKGVEKFGTKVEVKNMNSIRNVKRAIEFEINRQIELLEKGEGDKIVQETRGFDPLAGKTFSMRTKESANDYRYFPEPDLPPVIVEKEYVEEVKTKMPSLPNELYDKYINTLGLSDYDAAILTDDKGIALYFEKLTDLIKEDNRFEKEKKKEFYKAAANWVMGSIKSFLNENAVRIEDFPVKQNAIADIIFLIANGTISNSTAAQQLFPKLIQSPDQSPAELAKQLGIIQEKDDNIIKEIVKEVIAKYPEKVVEYRAGKKGLVGLFMGEVMKLSKGKADPAVANKLVVEMLNQD